MNIMKVMRSSKVLYFLLWLVILSFILWVFAYYGGGGKSFGKNVSNEYIVKVGNKSVTPRTLNLVLQFQREKIRNFLGEQYVDQLMKDAHKMATSNFIDSLILEDVAEELGVGVKDYEIAQKIQEIYKFTDPKTEYPQFLQSRGVSSLEFESLLRMELSRQKLTNLISQRFIMGEKEAEDLYRIENSKFKAKIVSIRGSSFNNEVGKIEDQEVKSLFEKEKETLKLPERRSLKYILVSLPSIRMSMEVGEDELKKYYDSNRNKFGEKQFEQVKNQIKNMILFSDEKYKEKANELFKNAVEELDKAKNENEINAFASKYKIKIENITNMSFDNPQPPFMTEKDAREAVFKAEKGKWSETFKTQLAGSAMKFCVTGIEAPRQATFEDVKEELKTRLKNEKLMQIAKAKALELKSTFKDVKSFEDEAKKRNFAVQESGLISLSDNLPFIGKNKEVAEKIYQSEPNTISGPFETKDGYVLAILLEKTPADMKKFTEEKDDFIYEKAQKKASDYINDLIAIKRQELENKKKIKINYDILKQYEPSKES